MVSAASSGFADPGLDSQRVFRCVLDVMARPGRIVPMTAGVTAPAPLLAAAASIVLAMADFETSIWLDAPLAEKPDVAAYLRFHTGAKIVTDPAQATFAIVSDPVRALPLAAFAQGSAEYPDRSTTLVVQCRALMPQGIAFTGPGIDGRIEFAAEPALRDLGGQLAVNRAAFPCGVDLIFVTAAEIAALPRSVRLVKG